VADRFPITGWFQVQGIVIYTAGIQLFRLTIIQRVGFEAATITCLVVCLITAIVVGDIFYRLVDLPSQNFACIVFEW